MYNVAAGVVEGAQDPGHLFQNKHHVMTTLSVLGLLQTKGCDGGETNAHSFHLMALCLSRQCLDSCSFCFGFV